jgi:hypothetical protein
LLQATRQRLPQGGAELLKLGVVGAIFGTGEQADGQAVTIEMAQGRR